MDENDLNKEEIFQEIYDLINKTIITVAPILKHNYRTCFPSPFRGSSCFEILGFDVILDRKCKPWLLEVNHSPSFHTDSKLDSQIKTALISDTLKLLDIKTVDRKKCIEEDRKRVQARLTGPRLETREMKQDKMRMVTDEWLKNVQQYEETNVSGFRRIYPPEEEDEAKKYKKFFNSSASLFQTTAAQRAREEAARIQLEELRLKNEIEQAKRQGRPIRDLNKFKKGESNIETSNPNLGLNTQLSGKTQTPSTNQLSSTNMKKYDGNSPKINKPRRAKNNKEPVDILLPVQILDGEENERKFQLRQRAAHIKSLGIVDIVHRAFNKDATPSSSRGGNHGMDKFVGQGKDIGLCSKDLIF